MGALSVLNPMSKALEWYECIAEEFGGRKDTSYCLKIGSKGPLLFFNHQCKFLSTLSALIAVAKITACPT